MLIFALIPLQEFFAFSPIFLPRLLCLSFAIQQCIQRYRQSGLSGCLAACRVLQTRRDRKSRINRNKLVSAISLGVERKPCVSNFIIKQNRLFEKSGIDNDDFVNFHPESIEAHLK